MAWFSGEVQGVGFRHYVRTQAAEREVDGWVMNLADGRVQMLAEGEPAELNRLLAAIQEGSLGSHIEDMELEKEKARGVPPGFHIKVD